MASNSLCPSEDIREMVSVTFHANLEQPKLGQPGSPGEFTKEGFIDDLGFTEEQYQNTIQQALGWFRKRFGIVARAISPVKDSDDILIFTHEDSKPSFILRPYRYFTDYRAVSHRNVEVPPTSCTHLLIVELVMLPLKSFTYGGSFADDFEGFDMSAKPYNHHNPSDPEVDTLVFGFYLWEQPDGQRKAIPYKSKEPGRVGAWGRQTESLLLDHPDCDDPYCGEADVSKINRPTSDCSNQTSLVNVWRVPQARKSSSHSTTTTNNWFKGANVFWVIICIVIIILIIWLIVRLASRGGYEYRRRQQLSSLY